MIPNQLVRLYLKLVKVHGHWNYDRLVKMIYYFLFKNILKHFPLLGGVIMDIRSQNTGARLPQNSLYIRQINVYLVPGKGVIDDFAP